MLLPGAVCLRMTSSRIHLQETCLTIVNPLFFFSIPYSAIYKVELSPGGSLIVHEKGQGLEDEGHLVVGFAGSLIDRRFGTAEKAMREVRKQVRKARHAPSEEAKIRKGISSNISADLFVCASAALGLVSLSY